MAPKGRTASVGCSNSRPPLMSQSGKQKPASLQFPDSPLCHRWPSFFFLVFSLRARMRPFPRLFARQRRHRYLFVLCASGQPFRSAGFAAAALRDTRGIFVPRPQCVVDIRMRAAPARATSRAASLCLPPCIPSPVPLRVTGADDLSVAVAPRSSHCAHGTSPRGAEAAVVGAAMRAQTPPACGRSTLR